MQFQVGDRVVHPVYGVGTIISLSKQKLFGDKTHEYYQVDVAGATIWVPIDDKGTTILRLIAPQATLRECRRLLKNNPVRLNEDRKKRELELAELLKDRMLPSLCETAHALSARRKVKPLGASESNLFKKVINALSGEWAAADGVTVQTALGEIESLLQDKV